MIEKYEHGTHYDKLVVWCAHKGLPKPNPALLPWDGYCIDGIAMGFLLKTNSRQAFIDHVAADPEATPEERDKALNTLFSFLEDEAIAAGFAVTISYSNVPAIEKRLMARGYSAHKNFSILLKTFPGALLCQ